MTDSGIDFHSLREVVKKVLRHKANDCIYFARFSKDWIACVNAEKAPRKDKICGTGQVLYSILRFLPKRKRHKPVLDFLQERGLTTRSIIAKLKTEVEQNTRPPYQPPNKSKMKISEETTWHRSYEESPNQFHY